MQLELTLKRNEKNLVWRRRSLRCGRDWGFALSEIWNKERKQCGWHAKCIKSFFGTAQFPAIDLSEHALKLLADENVNRGLTVPGFQKISSVGGVWHSSCECCPEDRPRSDGTYHSWKEKKYTSEWFSGARRKLRYSCKSRRKDDRYIAEKEGQNSGPMREYTAFWRTKARNERTDRRAGCDPGRLTGSQLVLLWFIKKHSHLTEEVRRIWSILW